MRTTRMWRIGGAAAAAFLVYDVFAWWSLCNDCALRELLNPPLVLLGITW